MTALSRARPGWILLWTCFTSTSAVAQSPKPTVAEIEIVPSVVAIANDPGQTTQFVLEARLWSKVNNQPVAIPESYGVKVAWSVSPARLGLQVVKSTSGGYRATLELNASKVGLTRSFIVSAQAGGLMAESTIVPAAVPAKDTVTASYTTNMIPDALAVHGIPATQPCSVWSGPAFTRTGYAGDVRPNCTDGYKWALAVLDPAHAAEIYDVPWTNGLDWVKTTPAPVRSVPVVLRVFLGGTASNLTTRQNDARTFTLAEMDDADTVFKNSRVGIDLAPVNDQIVTAASDETSVTDCGRGDGLTSSFDYYKPPAAPAGTPAMLHVYVVDDLGNADGFTCPPTPGRPFPVIYLREAQHSGTILVHELGHALGLDLPGAGHSDDMDHFDAANVMVSGYAYDNVWRRRLTVGQVFRMTGEGGSWLNWGFDRAGNNLRNVASARLACQCGFDDPAGGCPRLVDDVAKPRGSKGRLHAWDCSDVVRVSAAGSAAEPMALLAGRLWRTEPAATSCRQDHVGKYLDIAGVSFIQSENLTGGCVGHWVAIFFRDHQPVYSDLANVPGTWSDAADFRKFDPPLFDLKRVTIRVYYQVPVGAQVQGATDQTAASILQAGQVYGPANRTGLALTLESVQGSCPATASTDHVCYSPGGTSVAQLLWTALGLPLVPLALQSSAAFAGNALLTAGAGTKLTLGQVFRLQQRLQALGLTTSGFPADCSGAESCPPLEAGFQP
jgi:hypothetical protein